MQGFLTVLSLRIGQNTISRALIKKIYSNETDQNIHIFVCSISKNLAFDCSEHWD